MYQYRRSLSAIALLLIITFSIALLQRVFAQFIVPNTQTLERQHGVNQGSRESPFAKQGNPKDILIDLLRQQNQKLPLPHELGKIQDVLLELLIAELRGNDLLTFAQTHGLIVAIDKKVLVEIYAHGDPDDAIQELAALGMTEILTGEFYSTRIVGGQLPVTALIEVARLKRVKAIHAVVFMGLSR